MGSGRGPVGRVVASDTRDPLFESSHLQNLLQTMCLLLTIEKSKIKSDARNGPLSESRLASMGKFRGFLSCYLTPTANQQDHNLSNGFVCQGSQQAH